nr:hypothetical protein [Tanacetum cinerariifolium]
MIRVKGCRPIGIKNIASWVKGKVTWVCWVESVEQFGCSAGVREARVGKKEE